MKKLVNNPDQFVVESLQGFVQANSKILDICLDPLFVFRRDVPIEGKVAIVSGGGSGHEPLHSGFVGAGMLDAACPGEVFTSPTPNQMSEAAKRVHGGSGILLIVKNYSGDVMNFDLAAEMVQRQGIPVASVIVDDDVAVRDSLYTQGRRGVGTTVIVEKICGAAAGRGYSLNELQRLGQEVSSLGRSMGVALAACTMPTTGKLSFDLSPEQIEFGIGIHGEPGRERIGFKKADEIVEMVADTIIDDPAYVRTLTLWDCNKGEPIEKEIVNPPFKRGDEVILLLNGMGGTPLSELFLLYPHLTKVIEMHGLKLVRNLVGTYITSLDMQGFSITLVRATAEMIKLWDAPVSTSNLCWGHV